EARTLLYILRQLIPALVVSSPWRRFRGNHNHTGATSVLPRHAESLYNRRQDCSRELRSESSLPTPSTTQPVQKEVRSVIGVEVTQPQTITILPGEARIRLLIRRLLIHELVVPPPEEDISKSGTQYNLVSKMLKLK
ncbi:hypothetical protein AVEN_188853-1, partial [Araneus ventricosus]